jgi:O-antigen/teichoic acid export membrane protein
MIFIQDLFQRLKTLSTSSLARVLSLYGLSSGFGQIFTILYSFLIARGLGPVEFGLLSAHYAVAALTTFFVNLGMDTWMLRAGATHTEPRRLTGFVLRTKLLFGLVWYLLLLWLAPLAKPSLFMPGLLAITALDILGDALLTPFLIGLNIARTTNKASLVLVYTRLGRFLVALFFFIQGSWNIDDIAITRCLVTYTGVFLAFLVYRPQIEFRFFSLLGNRLTQFIVYGLPEMFSLIYSQADVTILGVLLNSQAVGWYFPAVSLINSIFVVYSALYYLLVPELSKVIQIEMGRLKKFIVRLFLLYSGIGMLFSCFVLILARPVVRFVLGDSYSITGVLLQILAPILFVKAISFGCAAFLISSGEPARRILPQALSALVNVGLNIIFIPKFGVFAVPVSYLISETVLLAGYLFTTFRQYRLLVTNSKQSLISV